MRLSRKQAALMPSVELPLGTDARVAGIACKDTEVNDTLTATAGRGVAPGRGRLHRHQMVGPEGS